ncbi:MAG: acyclic terpene utilization AtuA family protein, partial [Hydrogenophaga sp.]
NGPPVDDSLAIHDIRLRVAANTRNRTDAEAVTREVMSLYTCGPAGGGGVRTLISNRLASDSCLVPRDWVQPTWSFVP